MLENCNDLLVSDKLFDIQHLKISSNASMATRHYHHHYEIYYQLSGERYYFIKDRSYYIKKGDLVIINMFDLHKTSYAGTNDYERILINFKAEYIDDYLAASKDIDVLQTFKKSSNVYRLSLQEQTFVERLLNKMMEEKEHTSPGSHTYLRLNLMELLIFISRQSFKPQKQYLEFPSTMHKKISLVTRYINANFSNKLTLNQLALDFQVSPFYLSRTFKEVTGFSFIEYLNITRVKEAQRLLIDTRLSITDISQEVGFESPTHFGRVFKSITQNSPLKFRKTNYKSM